MRIVGVALLALALGCRKDAPASVASPTTGSASAAATMSAPSLTLGLTTTASHGPDGDSLKLSFVLTNVSAQTVKVFSYRPLGFSLVATDPTSAKTIAIAEPTLDFPVERISIVLAPGESRRLETAVTLWFDPSGKLRGSMFDWTLTTKKIPVSLFASLSLEVDGSDGGQLLLHATAIAP